jgi:hypothetical protein
MLIRILGLIVGLLFVAMPFLDSQDPKAWIAPILGAAFIVYGLGGHRLLMKAVPLWSKRLSKPVGK